MKVSVHMPAYNHAPWIGEAVDSVLAQKAGFEWELVIGEDCSTDATRDVARAYARANPGRVRLLEHPRNLGIWDNDQAIIAACRGEYIAWLESDDYWTSPHKLQRMVDVLDSDPGLSACFHRAQCQSEAGPPVTWQGGPPVVKPRYGVDDLLAHGHFMPSCTVVFRSRLVREPLAWTRGTPFLETAYALRFALNGDIGFVDEEMATFRFRDGGVYGTRGAIQDIRNARGAHRLAGTGFGLTDRESYRKGLARLNRQLLDQLRAEGLVLRAAAEWLSQKARGE